MKKSMLIIFMMLVLFCNNAIANTNKLALELARSKNLTTVIQRVNIIKDFINLYTLQEAKTPANIEELTAKYTKLSVKSFSNNVNISFSVSNNIIEFQNIIPDNSSNLIKQIFINSQNLSPNTMIDSNLTMSMMLDTKTIKFLSVIDDLNTSENYIQFDSPVCIGTNEGNLWYKPDSVGGFKISFCNSGNWTYLSNKINIVILRDSKGELDPIKPQSGTIGYVESNNTATKYIYSTTHNKWLEINN